MIVALEGILEARAADSIVLKVGGISLSVFVPTSSLGKLGKPGDLVRVHTHLHIREDVIALYGFPAAEDLEMFRGLISVSGFGPKSALALLSFMSANEVAGAVVAGDTERLTRVPGIGKKTADRLVLELKGKMEKGLKSGIGLGSGATHGAGGDDTSAVVAALYSLGYTMREAAQAVESLRVEPGATLENKVKQALRGLARR